MNANSARSTGNGLSIGIAAVPSAAASWSASSGSGPPPIADGPDADSRHFGRTLDVVDERGLQTVTDGLDSIIGHEPVAQQHHNCWAVTPVDSTPQTVTPLPAESHLCRRDDATVVATRAKPCNWVRFQSSPHRPFLSNMPGQGLLSLSHLSPLTYAEIEPPSAGSHGGLV